MEPATKLGAQPGKELTTQILNKKCSKIQKKIRINLQQNNQGVNDRFVQFQTGVTQRFTMEDQKFSRRFVEVHEKDPESQKATEANLHHFQTDVVQKLRLKR